MPTDAQVLSTLIEENKKLLTRHAALQQALASSLTGGGATGQSVKATLQQALQGLDDELTALLDRLRALQDQP